ncbi:polyprenyl diphosphate synthase [Opacimonas viscosa]|jgi:undecaprenyl diphosphate synthase|uniref:Ditrans,polycis-undecaprenyl-diphosphate synthase ((2E,6E)-farnesyl-diphosphate specific) n=1 Tax=Opacimonas viscosa TaxID=2961944 RepID=A0AA41X0K6_9ALTE|nr:polyprenyl diphosphate synthase [Opacimonas viscosa]MCP3427773.1 polyprenyl diphosphate synthase [Opacimonas viscosa]
MEILEKEPVAVSNSIPTNPQHVAIIMDGNGRWAKQKGKLRTFGHKAGVESVRASVRYARKNGISALTLFAFSSENWKRPKDEVSVLMELFKLVLSSEVKKLHKNGVRLKVIGDLSAFDASLVKKIQAAEILTQNNTELNLNIAANYGGRWDITEAAKKIAVDVAKGRLLAEDVDESVFDSYTSFAQLPDLDLLIRTGGEERISNFLLWQCAYAEFYFTDILWPDFNEQAFADAISAYKDRQRRFGKISEQIT